MNALVELSDLTVSYRRHPAVHHVSGVFSQGSQTALIGPNGAGKTSLLKSLLGLVPIDHGVVRMSVERRHVAYLPQRFEIDQGFPLSVLDCVLTGYWQRFGLSGSIPMAMRSRALQALDAVGLSGYTQRSVGTLSGGQFQRMVFARILVQDAQLILLDEPFAAIDATTIDVLLELIGQWHEEGRTIITVLHDLDLVRRYFPQTLLLARRVVAWGDTDAVLSEENLRQARTSITAWDDHAGICAQGEERS